MKTPWMAAVALMSLTATVALDQAEAQPGATTPPPAFEVASVKAATAPTLGEPVFCIVPCAPGERLTLTGSRVDIRFMPLQQLIATAYRVKPYQLSGPDWLRTQRFDVAAKIPEGVSKDRLPEMLQSLLAERFKLAVHREPREQTVLALVVGKSGSKLQPSPPEADAPIPETPGSRVMHTPQGDGRVSENGGFTVKDVVYGPIRGGRGAGGGMRFEFLKLTMPALVELLAPHVDRPLVDMTGLTGTFSLVAENRPQSGGRSESRKGPPPEGGRGSDGEAASARQDPFGEGLLLAVGKAGLRLESRQAPIDNIVIDHVEKIPTSN